MKYQILSTLFCATVATAVYAPPTYISPYVSPAPAAYLAPAAKIAAVPAYAHPVKYAPIAYAAPKAAIATYDAEYDPTHRTATPTTSRITSLVTLKANTRVARATLFRAATAWSSQMAPKRTVEYTADPHNGFNAVVHKEPSAYPAAAKAYPAPAPLPVLKYAPAPTKYVLPAAKYAQPAVYAYAPAPAPLVAYAH